MAGRRSQTKGRRGEQELAKLLCEAGFNVRPGRPRSYGSEPDLVGLDRCHIEVKRGQQLRIAEWLQQCEGDAKRFNDGYPTLIFRRNREPWHVCMLLDDWLTLYKSFLQQNDTENNTD